MICYQCGSPTTSITGPDNNRYCSHCFRRRFRACYACGNLVASGIESNDLHFFCSTCYSSVYSNCHSCHREINNFDGQNRYIDTNNRIYCRDCYDESFFRCYDCGETFETGQRHVNPGGDSLCEECFNDSCCTCNNCGTTLWSNDALYEHDHTFCGACHPASNEWGMGDFCVENPSFQRIRSTRKFGVELETSECCGYRQLKDNTIWECKHDCSIDGMEFVSPILYGDEGLEEIEGFCKVAKRMDFRVNRSCGFHAHFDVSNESEDSLRSIAYAYCKTYNLWCSFVAEHRGENRMCGSPDYTLLDIKTNDNFDYFVGKRDRFEFVNWRAYLVHGSFEVRLYQGTLDAEEICNWVIMHARFIDAVSKMCLDEIDDLFSSNKFEALVKTIGPELAEYWATRAEHLGTSVRELIYA